MISEIWKNKLALLWGEAQLSFPFVHLRKEEYRNNQLEKLECAKAALLGLTGPYWALPGLTGPYWALLVLTRPFLGLTGHYLGLTEP